MSIYTVLSLRGACTLNPGGKVINNVSGPLCLSNSSSASSVQQSALGYLNFGNVKGQEIR